VADTRGRIRGAYLLAVALVIGLAGLGCGSSSTRPPTSERPSPVSQPSPSGGCGDTPAMRGSRPSWMPAPDDDSTPYVIAIPAVAAAVLPVQPLRAGHPRNPNNKVPGSSATLSMRVTCR
jgi:hypothetical protein